MHEGLMTDWVFATILTIVNFLFTLYILKPRRSTFRQIFWVCMLFFMCLYPLALFDYHLNSTSTEVVLGLAFLITASYSGILIFCACWVWVIRRSFLRR